MRDSRNHLIDWRNTVKQWGLTVNVSKTKHMILNYDIKYLVNQTCVLHFNGENIDRTESTKYLGIEFSHDGNMQIAKLDLYRRG